MKKIFTVLFCLATLFSSSIFAIDLQVSGITGAYAAANGIYYLHSGTKNGYSYWEKSGGAYNIHYALYSDGTNTYPYWYIDNDYDDNNGLYYSSDGTTPASPLLVTGWSFDLSTEGTVTVSEYSTVPEINLMGNGVSIVSGDNTPSFADYTKFASTDVSGGTSTRTYTIYNTGTVDALTVGAITIGGANAADFTVTASPASTVSHGSSTTFTITFNPSSSGEKTATVSIVNNDSNENPYEFTISGYGYTPKNLVVSGITSPAAANGTYTHQGVSGDFQYWKHSTLNYYIYYSLSSRNWIISNTSTTGGTWYFSSFSDLYSPTGLIYSPSSGTGTVAVNEEVAVPEINIKVGTYSISDGSSTTLYYNNTNFGSLEVASGTRAKSYTIENTGNATLTLSGASPYVSITGTNASDFSITATPSNSISTSGTTTFGITFNPSAAGTRTATVTILSNDDDEGVYTFAIQGEGVNPRNLVVSNIIVPSAANGTYIYQGLLNEFQYWKHQAENYYIYNSKFNGIDPVWYIDVDQSATLTTPSSYNFYSQTDYVSPVSVPTWTSSSGNSGTPTIQYTEPEINVTGNSINIISGDATPSLFDYTDLGWVVSGSISKSFTIQNTGIATLTLTGSSPYITFSGTDASQFSITSNPSSTIAAGGSTTFGVTFTPSSGTLGARTATLSISNDDSNENPYTFLVQSGVGVLPVITTQATTNIGTTNAIGNGNIITLGSPNPTAYGICFGTSANPDITGSKVDKGAATATGAFTAGITGLTAGATYHARAFATNNVGTVYGTDVTFTTSSALAEPGNVLNFDGTDDYVVTTDNDNGLTTFTIEAWVKWSPSATTDVQFICGKGTEQMEIHTGAGSKDLRFIPATGVYLDADNVLSTGVWTHVAVVYNPSASLAKMYINGSEVTLVNNGPNPISTAIANTVTSFYIGSRNDGTYRFKGSIDELRVWNLVRSQAEIQANMANTISGSSSGLINYYNFNEGTASGSNTGGSVILPDLTSNGNNGTITNFALTGSTSNWVESYALVVPVASAASSVATGSFTANWTAPATGTVNNYLLEVASDASFSTLLSGYNPKTIASSSITSTVTGLSANTNYYYRVIADKTSVTGTGAYSNSVTVTTSAPTITFTNGSGFAQSITPNSTDQVLGRFQLTADANGATLTVASIKLNNTRTGLSNLKLWSSTDAAFSSGSDTQLGSTVAADPLDGNSVSFSSFSSSIGTSGTYYFLTGDVSASPTGTVQGVIVQNSSLTISSGALTGTINNAVLSNNSAALPVELTSFIASTLDNKVTLYWNTATELNNYGFNVERCKVQGSRGKVWEKGTSTSLSASWETLGFVQGHGNSNSPKSYSFVDANPPSGKVQYRLKQIDFDGKYEYSDVVEVKVETPKEFKLAQNFPNPFNPETTIKYELPANSFVTVKVFDVLGREIATLVNGNEQAGIHQVNFDAKNLPSGMYVYKVQAGSYSEIKKMLLIK